MVAGRSLLGQKIPSGHSRKKSYLLNPMSIFISLSIILLHSWDLDLTTPQYAVLAQYVVISAGDAIPVPTTINDDTAA